MASTTGFGTGLHSVPTTSSATEGTTAARTALPAYVAPAVASAIGAFSAVVATWAIVATQTLHMSL